MKKILTVSENEEVINTVVLTCKLYSAYFCTDVFSDVDKIVHYIDYEIPEIKVLDFTSKSIDCNRILKAINDDAWLHYGGVIAVCKDRAQVEALEELKDNNVLSIQTVDNFKQHFSRILRILLQNQQFLFNRGMQDVIGGQEGGTFVCGNDPMDIKVYTNFLVSYLYNTNRISADDRYKLQMTFNELLTNAVEHGNLGITYQLKTQWLMEGKDMLELLETQAKKPEFANRKIHISYSIGKRNSTFTIKDDGDGFDWRSYIEKKATTDALHGRGISLSKDLANTISYNEKGNEVTFSISNVINRSNTIPGIINNFATIEYSNKQFVCREGEMSNDLFFILAGRFAVYSKNKLAAVLTPNDLFIGEMAFLLNDRRTASVVAVGDCRLIKIPKADFLILIRQNPHYGIFLSKMLAQRLARQTKISLELKNKNSNEENKTAE